MYSITQPFMLYSLSSVHAGSGSEIGIVDLPIQREKHTGIPKIESSSLKGAIRSTIEELVDANADYEAARDVYKIFGNPPTQKDENLHASAISFADARTLLFPVKSMRNLFAFVTSRSVIERLNYELQSFVPHLDLVFPVPEERTVSAANVLINNKKIVLEEYPIEVKVEEKTEKLAEMLEEILFPERSGFLKNRLVVLSDNEFSDFVNLSTEVNARIRINPKTGTVDTGALFYEENVPAETVFYSFLFAGKIRNEFDENERSPEDILQLLKDETYFPQVFQLGGNSTLGKGMLKKIWFGGAN